MESLGGEQSGTGWAGHSGSLLCFVPQRQQQSGINGVRTPGSQRHRAARKSFLLLSSPFFPLPLFLFLYFRILNSCDLQGNHGASPPLPGVHSALVSEAFSEQKLPIGLCSL